MSHPEDDIICKEILLESYQQAIDEGHLEMSLKPALDRLNEINGVVTTYSCEGHPERDIFHARVDIAVSRNKWAKMQTFIEELLPPDGGIASIEFCYHSGEDDIQQHVTIRTHPALVRQKAVKPLIDFADRLEKLTQNGFELGELVIMSTKRYPDDWPRVCEKCGSRDIKVTYSEAAGTKRVTYVECFACQRAAQAVERIKNTCPHCYSCMNFDGRGGMYSLREIPTHPGVFRCPNCERTYVKRERQSPTPISLLES